MYKRTTLLSSAVKAVPIFSSRQTTSVPACAAGAAVAGAIAVFVAAALTLHGQEHERRDVRPHAAAEFVPFKAADGAFDLQHPADWRAHPTGGRVNFGADDGLVPTGRGFRTIYGVIVDVVDDPLAAQGNPTLEASAQAIVDRVLTRNPHQKLHESLVADALLGGAPAYRAVLMGISPVTGRGERAEIVVRRYGAQLFSLILVSPAEDYALLEAPLRRVRNSVRIHGK
jgi:hypothetical protein